MIIEFEKPVSKSELLKIEGIESVKNTHGNNWIITGKDDDIRASLFKWSVDNNHTIISMQKEVQKLEDIFQQLTGN